MLREQVARANSGRHCITALRLAGHKDDSLLTRVD